MDIQQDTSKTVEFSKQKGRKDLIRLNTLSALSETTVYNILKTTLHRVRIICFCPQRSLQDHMLAFSRLSELIATDTMLDSACLERNFEHRHIVFRNGTVVYFYREPEDEV